MTDKQERLLNFILDFHKEYGYSPSIRERWLKVWASAHHLP